MNGLINKGVSSALARVFSRRAAILKIAEEKALGTRLKRFRGVSVQISMFWPRENWGESKVGGHAYHECAYPRDSRLNA